jgi:hypothetical protein
MFQARRIFVQHIALEHDPSVPESRATPPRFPREIFRDRCSDAFGSTLYEPIIFVPWLPT